MEATAKAQAQAGNSVALIGLSPENARSVSQALHQLSITATVLNGQIQQVLDDDRNFQACVVRLDPHSQPLLDAVRRYCRARHVAVLGICDAAADDGAFSQLGLNALLREPLRPQEIINAFRSLQPLMLRELRRYLRIPVVTEATLILTDGSSFSGLTRDISYGGLSLRTRSPLSPGNSAEAVFTLPGGVQGEVRGTILWRYHPDLIGIRFETDDQRAAQVRDWIDHYLEQS